MLGLILLLEAAGQSASIESTIWTQIAQYGPLVIVLALLLGFMIRVAPVYKEIKLRELEVRETESGSKSQQANALSQLADALGSIAVEQRRATENVQLLQRVNADSTDSLTSIVGRLEERLEKQENGCGDCHDRIERLEKYANAGTSSK